MRVYFAPLQGFTEAPYRQAHARLYGGVDVYCAPFTRMEHGEPRLRDLRDILQPNDCLLPQIIFRNLDEMRMLTEALAALGHKQIDLNMGCPFPPQVRRGRGAGFLGNIAGMEQVMDYVTAHPELAFSVKMRLGIDLPDGWRAITPILNRAPLAHITIHPRTAAQQYRGHADIEAFAKLADALHHPIIYNGDLRTTSDIDAIAAHFPNLYGIMLGRGLLARPSLAEEWRSATQLSDAQHLARLLQLHAAILAHYRSTLTHDAQILAKIKPFWEHPGASLPCRTLKRLLKATTLTAYEQALTAL